MLLTPKGSFLQQMKVIFVNNFFIQCRAMRWFKNWLDKPRTEDLSKILRP